MKFMKVEKNVGKDIYIFYIHKDSIKEDILLSSIKDYTLFQLSEMVISKRTNEMIKCSYKFEDIADTFVGL